MLQTGQDVITSALVIATVGSSVSANLILKAGAQNSGIGSIWPFTLVNLQVLCAAGAFAMTFLFYTMLLKRIPLSMAQALISTQFVFVIFAGNLLFREEIGPGRWVGIGLIAVGLTIIGLAPPASR